MTGKHIDLFRADLIRRVVDREGVEQLGASHHIPRPKDPARYDPWHREMCIAQCLHHRQCARLLPGDDESPDDNVSTVRIEIRLLVPPRIASNGPSFLTSDGGGRS